MPEIGIGLQSVGLGGLDQRVQIGTGLDPLDRVAERPVLAPEQEWADGILRAIVVDLQPTVVQVTDQLVPFVVQVAQRLAGRTAWRHLWQGFIQPAAQFMKDRPGMPLAMGVTVFRCQFPGLLLNPVQVPDQGEPAVRVTRWLFLFLRLERLIVDDRPNGATDVRLNGATQRYGFSVSDGVIISLF